MNNLAILLKEIDELILSLGRITDTPGEGQTLSAGNKKLSQLLGVLGVEVARSENNTREAKDKFEDLRALKTLENLEATKISVERAKLMALTHPEVKARRELLRIWEHKTDQLKAKSRSYWSYLDNSRSRLSWIKGDRTNA